MNYLEFSQTFDQTQPAPIYLVLGDQDYLIDNIRSQFLKLIPAEEREMNVGIYDMEETPISVALDDARSIPFFGERRLILIKRPYFLTGQKSRVKVDHDLNDLISYAENPEPSSIVVFLAPYEKTDSRKKVVKSLKKAAELIDINRPSESQIRQLIMTIVKEKGYQIQSTTVNQIIEQTGGNLTLIVNGLTKLFLYYQDTKKIEATTIDSLVSKSIEQNVFDLVNIVLKRRVTEAIELYKTLLLNGEEPLKINVVLIQQFRLLLQVAILKGHGYSQGNLAASLKVHPYRIKLALQSVNQFEYEDLRTAYLGLVELEQKLKSTKEDPEFMFERFLLNFVNNQINV